MASCWRSRCSSSLRTRSDPGHRPDDTHGSAGLCLRANGALAAGARTIVQGARTLINPCFCWPTHASASAAALHHPPMQRERARRDENDRARACRHQACACMHRGSSAPWPSSASSQRYRAVHGVIVLVAGACTRADREPGEGQRVAVERKARMAPRKRIRPGAGGGKKGRRPEFKKARESREREGLPGVSPHGRGTRRGGHVGCQRRSEAMMP